MSTRSSGKTRMIVAGESTGPAQIRFDQSELDLIVQALDTGDRQTTEQALETIETATVRKRRPGRFKGRLVVGDEFFEPLSPEVLHDFDQA
ncbi:hypothetical protein ACQKGC_02990 [Allorhizobium pseudoryzae]|uniref:hypothetical protein n=1 Tax=Allorhizobium pseudoryzae TaxID=379684 RepID=UPI003D05942B